MVAVRRLDAKMGLVLDALETSGLADRTLVICTTDHGLAFPRMKCTLTDAGIGVMLMLRGPEPFAGGRVVDSLVSHIDIFPTLCDWVGIDPPDWLQGLSFLPILRGDAEETREEVFAEVTYHAAYEPQRCVRTKRWKYIRRFDDRTRPVLPNCDDSPSKTAWMEAGWDERSPGREALYDLVFDPHEADNRAEDPGRQEVLADMRQRLERWMRETADPLLNGPVKLPKGVRANDPDGLSPREHSG
jgi:arylsulfatase A-like enzyme